MPTDSTFPFLSHLATQGVGAGGDPGDSSVVSLDSNEQGSSPLPSHRQALGKKIRPKGLLPKFLKVTDRDEAQGPGLACSCEPFSAAGALFQCSPIGSWVPRCAPPPGSETLKAPSLGDMQSVAGRPVPRHSLGVNIDKLE